MLHKTLHIINSLDIGGAENQLTEFLINADEKMHEQLDVLVLYGGQYRMELLKASGKKIINLNRKRKYDPTIIWEMIRIIRRGKYTLVMAQLFPTILYAAVSSFFLPHVKFVMREPNVYTRRRKYRLFKVIDGFIYSRYLKIVCVDRQVEESLLKWLPQLAGKTVTFPKGIVIPHLYKKTRAKYDIIFVGRLTRQKGVEILLKVAAELRARRVIKKVAIVGEGELTKELHAEARNLGIDDLVDFLGKRNDVENLLQQSRLFLLPSRWEGTPSALLEAMACGVPVLATSVGGVPYIIDSDVNGVLVPPGNIELMTRAAQQILTKKSIARRLGHNARKKVIRCYSIQDYTNRMIDFYRQIRN